MKMFGRLIVIAGLIALAVGLLSITEPRGNPWPWVFLGVFLVAGGMVWSFLIGLSGKR